MDSICVIGQTIVWINIQGCSPQNLITLQERLFFWICQQWWIIRRFLHSWPCHRRLSACKRGKHNDKLQLRVLDKVHVNKIACKLNYEKVKMEIWKQEYWKYLSASKDGNMKTRMLEILVSKQASRRVKLFHPASIEHKHLWEENSKTSNVDREDKDVEGALKDFCSVD